jgi:hypothetical protein
LEPALTDQGKLRVEIVCEDSEHEAFARRLFERWYRVGRRRIHFTKAPKGQGAASQWVTKQFPDFARRARANRHQARLGFLAITDGDSVGFAERKTELLRHAVRESDDRIAMWIPTWEIETWVLWLTETRVNGQHVHEGRSFKADVPPDRFRDLLQNAVEKWNEPRPDEASQMPSLNDARNELGRIV